MNESEKILAELRELREVGIDRGTAYDAFRELGYTSRDALKLLEKAGTCNAAARLSPNGEGPPYDMRASACAASVPMSAMARLL